MKLPREKVSYRAEWRIFDFKDMTTVPSQRFSHHEDFQLETFDAAKTYATRLMNRDPEMQDVLYKAPQWVRWYKWSEIDDLSGHRGYVFIKRCSEPATLRPVREQYTFCQGVLYLAWRAAAARREDRQIADILQALYDNNKEGNPNV